MRDSNSSPLHDNQWLMPQRRFDAGRLPTASPSGQTFLRPANTPAQPRGIPRFPISELYQGTGPGEHPAPGRGKGIALLAMDRRGEQCATMHRPRISASSFRHFHSSHAVIRPVVMVNVSLPMSLQNIEGLLFAANIRRQWINRMKGFRR